MSHRLHGPWPFLALTLAFVVAMAVSTYPHGAGRRGGAERATEARILARSSPLCHTLAPRAATLVLTPDRIRMSELRGLEGHYWEVLCDDPDGRSVARLIWDADDGTLEWVSHTILSRSERRSVSVSRGEAVRRARAYLYTLGFDTSSVRWTLADSPQLRGSTWRTRWRAGTDLVSVSLDAASGELLDAFRAPRGDVARAS